MSQRYAYWRTPAGEADKRADHRCAPTALLAEIGERATLTKEGGVQWKGAFRFTMLESGVRDSVVVIGPDGQELNPQDTWGLAHASILSVIKATGGRKPISPIAVINETNRRAASHFRRLVHHYVLVTSLSIDEFPATRIRVRGCEVSRMNKRTSRTRFPYPEAVRLQASRTLIMDHMKATKYLPVKVKTKGRSIYEAVDSALDALTRILHEFSVIVE